MKVKNVSAKEINIPELELSLGLGEVGDLSKFDPKILHAHKRLNAMFDKGLLVNLGRASIQGSKASLVSARDRISKMGLEGYVAQKASPDKGRSKIKDLMKKMDRRSPVLQESTSQDKYLAEHHRNMNPGQEFPEEYEKPRVKIDERLNSITFDSTGSILDSQPRGMIATGKLVPNSTYLNPKIENKVEVKDKTGMVFTLSLDNIEKTLSRKCIGTNAQNKLCKKLAVIGMNSCLNHMSKSEREEYDLKKSGK